MHLPPHTNIFIAVFSAVSQHSWSFCFSQQCGKPDLKPSHGHFTSEDSPKNQPLHVVYIWRFQSAIEFQSVNQTIPSACVPQKMSCVMRPANTARTLREHSANRTRSALGEEKWGKCRESSGWDGVLGSLHRISSENLGTWIYSAVRPTSPQVVIFPVIIRQ